MYQSLHTTVVDKEGIPFEVQIRTWDMHYTAEYGIAAHWKYKAGVSGNDKLSERLAWVRQLLEAQQESEDAEDLIRSIKTDLFSRGSICLYTERRCYQLTCWGDGDRFCICDPYCRGKPYGGRQSGWADGLYRL